MKSLSQDRISLQRASFDERLRSRSALAAGLLLAFLAGACHDSSHIVPVYQEFEINDTPADANYLGVLGVGDRILIEGVIGDPFIDIDGFSFTSASPIHVDFQLFADRDLDVCLYDPAIDSTVACFATANHPERGGVDVFGSGLEFHLTVEACIEPGCFPAFGTPYTLELTVQHLFFATAEGAEEQNGLDQALTTGATQSSIRGVDASQEQGRLHAPKSPDRYKDKTPIGEVVPDLILEKHIEMIFDEDTGTAILVESMRAISPRGE